MTPSGRQKHATPIWWVTEGQLAGMPMPWLDPNRREELGGSIDAYNDEMQSLWDAGIRSVACLLNIPGDQRVYESAGFEFLCMPLRNGGAPTSTAEMDGFYDFYRSSSAALAVHCEAGLGRTGTIVAMLLIAEGSEVDEAVAKVRAAQPAAIETAAQMKFLEESERHFRK